MKKILVVIILATFCLPVSSHAIPGFMKNRMGTLSGQVLYEGKPLAKLMLAFFDVSKGLPPIEGGRNRIPDLRGWTDGEGKFSIKLLQADYYIGIIIREPSAVLGPPREGETYYFADNGMGELKKFTVANYKQFDAGRIDCSLPSVFKDNEASFKVEGYVYQGEDEEKPYHGALVLAKSKSTIMRPEYISAETGEDGKFSIALPPNKTFYLMTRSRITGVKPEPGDDIGKYTSGQSSEEETETTQGSGPPPGISEKQPTRVINDEALPVSGGKGEILAGLKIYMYKMPDQQALQDEFRNATDIPNYEDGAALENLLFATNSFEIAQQSYAELDQWVRFFQGRFDINIELSGHTDNVGSEEYNMELSEKRAGSVAKYLMSKGINILRITVAGYGATRPISDNDTEEGRRRNRRVEIKFSK